MLTEKKVGEYLSLIKNVKKEVAKIIVGQDYVVNGLIKALISNGHVLIEGLPGLAKTLIIKALAKSTSCDFKRVQFTVDLLPADITGFTTYDPKKGFYTVKGPIFTNFFIADEVNRATPKLQSSLLEAMQEKQVTIGKETFRLNEPFFVMANNNPIESAAVYPLPEAQIDRFLFKLNIDYPSIEEERAILDVNTTIRDFNSFSIKSVIDAKKIVELQNAVKDVYMDEKVKKYIINLVEATRKDGSSRLKLDKYVEYGASPRASIGLYIASKADALMQGKNYVTPQNIKNAAYDVLRHRILLNYEGQAENVKTDDIIKEILNKIAVP